MSLAPAKKLLAYVLALASLYRIRSLPYDLEPSIRLTEFQVP